MIVADNTLISYFTIEGEVLGQFPETAIHPDDFLEQRE